MGLDKSVYGKYPTAGLVGRMGPLVSKACAAFTLVERTTSVVETVGIFALGNVLGALAERGMLLASGVSESTSGRVPVFCLFPGQSGLERLSEDLPYRVPFVHSA